jgi:DNA-directed RNA polymerase specialized sigma24 family protein
MTVPVQDRDRFKPTGEALHREIRRLWVDGLRPRDISESTHVPISEVMTALRPLFESLSQQPR